MKHEIYSYLKDDLDSCWDSVTELSKSDNNYFIESSVQMLGWDKVNKLINKEDYQSVDAIYPFMGDKGLTLYLFEFKNRDLLDGFDDKILFNECINNMKHCEHNCKYTDSLKKIKKEMVSKNILSLKLKPVETLILLNQILNDNGFSYEDIVKITKEYYVVSLTNVPNDFKRPNKSNNRRKGKLTEIFEFRNKLSPFPFINIEPINDIEFRNLVNQLEENKT